MTIWEWSVADDSILVVDGQEVVHRIVVCFVTISVEISCRH